MKWRPLRTTYFLGVVACALDDHDRTYEYEPRLGIELRKHLPDQVIFDGSPDVPWRAAMLRLRGMELFFGDPMFGPAKLRTRNGVEAQAGRDLLAESLRHPDHRDQPLPFWSDKEFAACVSELDQFSKQALPAFERALGEGLVQVSGINSQTQSRERFSEDAFRAALRIDPLRSTIDAGSIQITAVEIRIDPEIALDIARHEEIETQSASDVIGLLVDEMHQRVRNGSTVAEAARALASRVPTKKVDAKLDSLVKRLTVPYYKRFPGEKLKK